MTITIDRTNKLVRVQVETFGAYCFDGPIEDAIAELQKLRDAHPGEKMELVGEHDDDGFSIVLYVLRPETDVMRDARIANAVWQERREREQLAALQAKYGA